MKFYLSLVIEWIYEPIRQFDFAPMMKLWIELEQHRQGVAHIPTAKWRF